MCVAKHSGCDIVGKWIAFNDPEIDSHIDNILNEIVSKIVDTFNPDAIILDGSFAHGEGTVIKKEGEVRILSDFDLCFVKKGYTSRKRVKKFSHELNTKYNQKIGIYRNKPKKYLHPSEKNPAWCVNSPSVNIYTRKYGGKVLYGRDYLRKIPAISPEKIPVWHGLRLLLNRAGESLKYISYDSYRGKKLSEEEIFWAMKVLIACMEVFLIVNHNYHYSYREKLNRFRKLFPEKMDLSSSQKERFLQLIDAAISFKLFGEKSYLLEDKDTNKIWFDARELFDIMFRYGVKKQFDFEFKDYLEFMQKYLSHTSLKNFYRGPISSPSIQNIYYFLILVKNGYRLPLRHILNNHFVFPHMMYTGVLLIFFSISNKGKVNLNYLNGAKKILSFFGKTMDSDDPYLEWEYVRKEMVNLWHLLRL